MLNNIQLSKQDAVLLLDLIYESIACNSEDELRILIDGVGNLIPCDYVACFLGTEKKGSVLTAFHLVNVSYPDEWLWYYLIRKYHLIDPILRENFINFPIQNWADTYNKYDVPQHFSETAKDYGLREGYSHGIKSNGGMVGSMFSFAGEKIKKSRRTETILKHIIPHFHQALTRILTPEIGKRGFNISKREREILQWLKEGKSSWDISSIMNISVRTVNFHVSNIKAKLNVINRSQAVAVALEMGLVDVD